MAASYGLLVTSSLRRRAPLGARRIEGWVPVVLFATLFGLSMDYEVFLVSRMREAWDGGRDNADAVALGLERTGGLITASALVMAVSFAGLVVGSVPALRQLGTGLVDRRPHRRDARPGAARAGADGDPRPLELVAALRPRPDRRARL